MEDYSVVKERLLSEMMKIRKDRPPFIPTSSLKDEGEIAAASHEQAIAVNLVNGYTQQLVALQAALQRLDIGEYGRCMRCGKEIEEGRLKAMPTAELCCGCSGCKPKQESHGT